MDQIHLFKMKDPLAGSTYDRVYKDLKNISKHGEIFCKTLMSALQQRSNLELSYAKGLEKVANKLTKALASVNKNCINNAWTCASDEMRTTAEVHRKLGTAIQQEAIKPTSQVLEEHEKKKKKLDNEVEKMTSSVLNNWKQQIKVKKKLMEHTKKHEALFHHVENTNKQSVSEKEKQKLLSKLKKSVETLTKTDEEYYQENITGQTVRLKWENVLENCYTSIQDLEKERIQLLSHILTRYNQHVLTFGQTLNTCQSQIDQAIKSIDVEKDIQTFMEETAIYSGDNKSEFLLMDYFEEDSSVIMDKERRIASINMKLERLQSDIDKAQKDKDGLEKMLKAYVDNPAFSDVKNEENTYVLLEETNLKIHLLEANHFKLLSTLAELEGKTISPHPCSERISKWKEKGSQHSSVYISRSINTKKLKRLESHRISDRSRGRMSHSVSFDDSAVSDTIDYPSKPPRGLSRRVKDPHEENTLQNEINEHQRSSCTVLYPYKPQRQDELGLQKGDLLEVHHKDDDGWWYGSLNGKKGYFPSTYVQEHTTDQSSHA